MHLADQRVLITGAGHGLGRAIALEFARAGAVAIVADRDTERVQQVVAEIELLGARATGLTFDVTSPNLVCAARERLHAQGGPISVLVNNAGVVFGGEFQRVALEQHQTTIAVNLTGLINVIHAFLPDLLSQPQSRIVNIASAAAVLPLPLAASYAATKWAVFGFTESLREELHLLGHRQVRLSAICPSYIATGLFDGAQPARFTRLLTPETVATAVRRATERGSPFVMLPRSARVMYALASLLPRPLHTWVCRRLGVANSMRNWRGHRTTSGAKTQES